MANRGVLLRIAALLLGLALALPAPAATPVTLAVAFGVAESAATGPEPAGDDPSPLFTAADAVGLPEGLALQLSEIFAEEFDFHRDLDRGYLCTVIYEMTYPDGRPVAGRILAARLATPTRRAEAFLFPAGNESPAYFDAQGLDINKTLRLADPEREPWLKALPGAALDTAFRRSPLEFSRITSRPAALRYHPILKEWRAHRGTDYGAPVGTRVRATADGVVVFAGTRNSYGRLVELRHYDRYTSRYGHLDGFAPGLAKGRPVLKGEVIGRVGMTGLATGPHLHYELHADPGASPPERLAFAVRAVPPERQAEFQALAAERRAMLAYAEDYNRLVLRWPARRH